MLVSDRPRCRIPSFSFCSVSESRRGANEAVTGGSLKVTSPPWDDLKEASGRCFTTSVFMSLTLLLSDTIIVSVYPSPVERGVHISIYLYVPKTLSVCVFFLPFLIKSWITDC